MDIGAATSNKNKQSMKKKLTLAIIGAALCAAPYILSLTAPMVIGVTMVGCTTTNNGTNGTNVVNQQVIDATAIILRGAARDGAIVAITPPNGDTNNAEWFNLAATGLSTFITGKDYTPGAFQQALLSINSSATRNQWVQIAAGTLIDLYQLYYGQYVATQLNGSDGGKIAIEFLTAIQDGFNQALGNPTSIAVANTPLNAKAAPQNNQQLLPRPIRK